MRKGSKCGIMQRNFPSCLYSALVRKSKNNLELPPFMYKFAFKYVQIITKLHIEPTIHVI